MPSIIGYNEEGADSWPGHLCLVNPDLVLDNEDDASAVSEKHLADARKILDSGGSALDFAIALRQEGYKRVSDFRVAKDER